MHLVKVPLWRQRTLGLIFQCTVFLQRAFQCRASGRSEDGHFCGLFLIDEPLRLLLKEICKKIKKKIVLHNAGPSQLNDLHFFKVKRKRRSGKKKKKNQDINV